MSRGFPPAGAPHAALHLTILYETVYTVKYELAEIEACMTTPQPKLLDQVRGLMRGRHYSLRTEESYVNWIRRFVQFHGLRHPRDMGRAEVERFLTHLAVEEQVAASTQNQARCAILF